MVRSYLIPETVAAWKDEPFQMRRPDYLEALGITAFQCRDYGEEPLFLTQIDATDAQHDALVAQPGVVYLGPDEPPVVTPLGLPIVAGPTYLRQLHRVFTVMQRAQGAGLNPVAGRSLETVLDATEVQTWARAGLRVLEGQTLREALLMLADQAGDPPPDRPVVYATPVSYGFPGSTVPLPSTFTEQRSAPNIFYEGQHQAGRGMTGDGATDWAFAFWNADVLSADQYSRVECWQFGGGYSGVNVRCSGVGAATKFYAAYTNENTRIAIYKCINAVNTELVRNDNGITWVAGKVIELRVVGTRVSVSYAGVTPLPDAMDAAIASGFGGGIASYGGALDNLETGNLGTPALVVDSFTRANASTLGPNWTTNAQAFTIVNNEAFAPNINEVHIATWTASAFGPDQFAEVTLGAAFIQYSGPVVRCSGSGASNNCYYALLSTANTGSLGKNVAGVGTNLVTGLGVVNPGDVIRLEVLGTRLRLFVNGVQVAQAFDTAVATGAPGITCYAASVVHGEITSFTADTLVGVARDGAPVKAGDTTVSLPFNVTLSGSKGFVAVLLKWYGPDDIGVPTLGGIPLVRIAVGSDVLPEGTRSKAYGLMTGSLAGVQSVVIPRSSTNYIIAAAQAYTGVSQTGQPIPTAVTVREDRGSTQTAPVVAVAIPGSWVVGGVIASGSGNGFIDAGAGDFLIDSDTVVLGILGLYDSGGPLASGVQAPVAMGKGIGNTNFDSIAFAIAPDVPIAAADDFNRADNASLGANWTPQLEVFSIASNQAWAVNEGVAAFAFWNQTPLANDQYAEVVVGVGFTQYIGPMVRASGVGASAQGYYATISSANAGAIGKLIGGSFAGLATLPPMGVAGDVLRLQVNGSTLRAYLNGVQVGTDVIDTAIAGGSAGIAGFASAQGYYATINAFAAGNAVPLSASIARDGAAQQAGADTTRLAFSPTLAGVNEFVALAMKWYGADDLTAVTLGGLPMVLISTGAGTLPEGTRIKVYGLMAGALVGPQAIVITRATSGYILANAQAYTGVSQAGQPAPATVTAIAESVYSTAPTIAVGVANSWAVGVAIAAYSGNAFIDLPAGDLRMDNSLVISTGGLVGLYDSGLPLAVGAQAPISMSVNLSFTPFQAVAFAVAPFSAAPPAVERVQAFILLV